MEAKKVLSQWEIDALLSSLDTKSGGQAAPAGTPGNVKAYDFRRPDKFSKDHIRSIQLVHENFARIASSALSSYLRMGVRVHLSSVEQITHDEYIQQLSNPTLISIVSMAPLPGRMILEMSLMPAYAIMDRLLGGQGRGLQKQREVTDVEVSLLESLAERLLGALEEAWAGVVKVVPHLVEMVLNPQMIQAASTRDVVILILLEIQVSDCSGTITLCVPSAMLEPLMGKLGSQLWFSSSRTEGGKLQDIEILRHLEEVEVPLTVHLGTSSVTVRDLLSLQKGNVIRLENSAYAELPVLVGAKTKFYGRPGRVGRSLAVRITKVLDGQSARLSEWREAVAALGGNSEPR